MKTFIDNWPVPEEDKIAGNFKCLGNTLIVRILDDPWSSSLLIRPDAFTHSQHMSMVVKVMARGPGYKKKRKHLKYFAKGSMMEKDGVGDYDQADHHPFFIGDIHPGRYFFIKHPWVKDNRIWVRDIHTTHPQEADLFSSMSKRNNYDDPVKRSKITSVDYACFIVPADEMLLELILSDDENEDAFHKVERGGLLSAA